MITVQQEESVRSILAKQNPACPKSFRKIARETGVSHSTVCSISRNLDLVMSFAAEKREEVRRLLLSGLPNGAVVANAKVHKSAVLAIKRHYYLQYRRHSAALRKCKACGSIVYAPTEIDNSAKNRSTTRTWSNVGSEDVNELARVVDDVCELSKILVFTNPLFYHLAERAKKVLEVINDKKTTVSE